MGVQYGYEGLQQGMMAHNDNNDNKDVGGNCKSERDAKFSGEGVSPSSYQKMRSREVFEKFFGKSSNKGGKDSSDADANDIDYSGEEEDNRSPHPFAQFNPYNDNSSIPFHSQLRKDSSEKSTANKKKADPVMIDLPCTLEELHFGCKKTVRITRKRYKRCFPSIDDSAKDKEEKDKNLINETKVLHIPIEMGMKDGDKITFPNEGDEVEVEEEKKDDIDDSAKVYQQQKRLQPADVIFTIKEKQHCTFERRDSDIVHTTAVSLLNALTEECSVRVPTLDGHAIFLDCPEVICHNYEKRIKGEGLSLRHGDDDSDEGNGKGKRGDLIVRFHVLFPRSLDRNVQLKLRELLVGIE
mmetsp:Transcript_4343/g.6302  ORF Transcript_4343/g.6302 Transcript_4343/m.6302 type:complete len:354 (-) Transcript_4343:315-1376(-)